MKRKVDKSSELTDDAAKPLASDPFESLAESPLTDEPPAAKASANRPVTAKRVRKAATKAPAADAFDAPAVEFTLGRTAAVDTGSSPVKKAAKAKATSTKTKAPATKAKTPAKQTKTSKTGVDVTAAIAAAEPVVEVSPVFKALSEPVLPILEHENRAQLLMQSPTKLYFYWSVKENPYQMLRDAFGSDTGSYTLVLKLTDLRNDTELILPADVDGKYWFDVEADGEYQAEVGFYAVNRPYFRIIYSNTVETPRKSPSLRVAVDSDWTVSANKFAEVLDVSGFTHDAFDVAMIGDDPVAAESATKRAFTAFAGTDAHYFTKISAEDMRQAMYAFASGQTLEDLRTRVSPALFARLQERSAQLDPEKAASALTHYFGTDETDITEEHHLGPAVYGASLINFPRTLRTSRTASRYAPVSSPSGRS